MRRNWKKKRGLEDQVSEKPYLFEPTEDPILLSDELDIDMFVELPVIDTENENAQTAEEEEPVEVGYVGLSWKNDRSRPDLPKRDGIISTIDS